MTATIILEPDVMRVVPDDFDLAAVKRAVETGDTTTVFEMRKPSTSRHIRNRRVRFTTADLVEIVDGDRAAARAALAAKQVAA